MRAGSRFDLFSNGNVIHKTLAWILLVATNAMSHLRSVLYLDHPSREASSLLRHCDGVYYAPVQLGAAIAPFWVALHGITSEPMALQASEVFTQIGQAAAVVELRVA